MARSALAFCWLWAATSVGAAPSMFGLHSAGELGLLDFSTAPDGTVVGKYKRNGVCGFKPDVQVLTGTFEGNVFVGRLLLCQQGPSCEPEKTYPFLGIWAESSISGDVKLSTSCTSPGLHDRHLSVTVATQEERLQGRQETGSAALIANGKPISKKEREEAAEKSLVAGWKKFSEGDYSAARQHFEHGLAYNDENWAAQYALGTTELRLNNPEKALLSLRKAMSLTKAANVPPPKLGSLHYDLACALIRSGQKREALGNLQSAVKLVGAAQIIDSLETDKDLEPMRGDSEFKVLLANARVAAARTPVRKRSP